MDVKKVKVTEIHPYENNPRNNNGAKLAVAESIKQCGYVAPIIVDENMVILAGHTRYRALTEELGWSEVEVIVKKGLTEEQKKKYRLLDNKTNEFAQWDFQKLEEELGGLDFGGFDFSFTASKEIKELVKEGDFGESDFKYQSQYGVTVMCAGESEQEEVYNILSGMGYTCKVVTV